MTISRLFGGAMTGLGCLLSASGISGVSKPHAPLVSHEPSGRGGLVPDSTGATKRTTQRIVVGEYLTGTFCGACQAHEEAFDSLLHRYPSTQFIALAYHQTINFPIADPADSLYERIGSWYGDGGVFPQKEQDDWIDGHGTWSSNNIFSNDNPTPKFIQAMTEAIDADLKRAPEAVLQVEATPKNGTLVTTVRVDSLAPGHPDTYVRIVVVEDTVILKRAPKYAGKQYPRTDHYMVVRAAARDAAHPLGLPLHGIGSVSYTFDLAKEQTRMLHYWQSGLGAIPGNWYGDSTAMAANIDAVKDYITIFPEKESWMMNPARLHVVAFVQDAKTGDVLQTKMVSISAANGTPLKLN